MEEARTLDRRVRRTRALLENGLLALLAEKGLDHIAMREVCRRADVATATPYAHYRDVVDILMQMENRFSVELSAILTRYPHDAGVTGPLLADLMVLADAERGLCKALLCHAADPAFLKRIQTRLEEDLAARLHQPEGALRASFLMGGCLAVIRQWLMAKQPEPPSQMAAFLLSLMK